MKLFIILICLIIIIILSILNRHLLSENEILKRENDNYLSDIRTYQKKLNELVRENTKILRCSNNEKEEQNETHNI